MASSRRGPLRILGLLPSSFSTMEKLSSAESGVSHNSTTGSDSQTVEVLEDAAELASWTRRSVAVAMNAAKVGVQAPRWNTVAAFPMDGGRPRRER